MKQLFIILVLIVSLGESRAQSDFSAGIEGDFCRSKLFNYSETLEPVPANAYGIYTQLHFNKRAGLSISFLRNTINPKKKENQSFPDVKLSYFDMPVLLQFTSKGDFKIYFETGFQFSFLLNADDVIYDSENSSYMKTGDYFNSSYSSFILGIGIKITVDDLGMEFKKCEQISLAAGFRMGFGLSNATNSVSHGYNGINDIQNMSFIFSGLHIGLVYSFLSKEK